MMWASEYSTEFVMQLRHRVVHEVDPYSIQDEQYDWQNDRLFKALFYEGEKRIDSCTERSEVRSRHIGSHLRV